MATKVAQYITVIDRSNKVIGNSRQFKDVFREAKSAYLDRKAEIKEKKKVREEVELQKAIRAVSIQDETERASTIRPDGSRRHDSRDRRYPTDYERPRGSRTQSTTSVSPRDNGQNTPREGTPRQMSLGDFNDAIYGPNGVATQHRNANASRITPGTPIPAYAQDPARYSLVRAQTDLPLIQRPTHQLSHSRSLDEIDMDLAYGEYHPESLIIPPEAQRQKELSSLVLKCKLLLEEADCAGHSAKAIITHLQKNPDTLAAVGLTLAEISSLASKMAPGTLGIFAKSAPAVIALLASPQFLIAVGVSVGVTVIAIGGYKIIKRIKEKTASSTDDTTNADQAYGDAYGPEADEAIDVQELDRIERWRRGIPDEEQRSVISTTTSVEGEFITPFAAQSMGHLPIPMRQRAKTAVSHALTPKQKDKSSRDKRSDASAKKEKRSNRRHRSDEDSTTTTSTTTTKTARKVSTTTSGSKSRSRSAGDKTTAGGVGVKVKKPSTLSRMFGAS